MLAGALQTNISPSPGKFSYDIQSDWELSRLLTALDEQAGNLEIKNNTEKVKELKHLAETVVDVLESRSESAEVFIQLAERALNRKDYEQIDKLSDALLSRFSVSEVCEIVRQTDNPAIRALGIETLAIIPTEKLVQLIDDSLYDEIIRGAIEQQAFEFENEQARQVLEHIGFADEMNED